MLRIIQLITIAAAATISADVSKANAKAHLKYEADVKAMSKKLITSTSKISLSKFEMPAPAITYKTLIATD